MLQQRLEQDLKTALLNGDATQVNVLRSLKSAITYAEVARGVKGGDGLDDQELIAIFSKEAKKRQESADLFRKGGRDDRAEAELQEKEIIQRYLPPELSAAELEKLVDNTVAQADNPSMQAMGAIIAKVKEAAQGQADGSTIARLVKERLQKQ